MCRGTIFLCLLLVGPVVQGMDREERRPVGFPSPLSRPVFIENRGQYPDSVRFVASVASCAAAFEASAIVLRPWVAGDQGRSIPTIRLEFEGASTSTPPAGEGRVAGSYCFLRGRDPSRWRGGVASYSRIVRPGIYEGIDLRVRFESRDSLEYDLILSPGANIDDVVVRCTGADAIGIDEEGSLCIRTSGGVLRQPPPRTWHELPSGKRRPVPCAYRLLGRDRFGFDAKSTDPDLPLVIDPVLDWATYMGGWDDDMTMDVARAEDGVITVAGWARSPNFPSEPGNECPAQGSDAFVARLSSDGEELLSCTFLGGMAKEEALGVELDAEGRAVVVGYTLSPDFPVTTEPFHESPEWHFDGFVTVVDPDPELDPEDRLVYSTLVGGQFEDACVDLAIDGAGRVLVGGYTQSADFPTTPGAIFPEYRGGEYDIFVIALRPDSDLEPEDQLEYGTFLGGSGADVPPGTPDDGANLYARFFTMEVALGEDGLLAITGETRSADFPLTAGAVDRTASGAEAYVAVLDPRTDTPGEEQLRYSTLLGGEGNDGGSSVTFDREGAIVVAGWTESADYPTTPGVFSETIHGNWDGFVTRLMPDPGLPEAGVLLYSTFLGSKGWERLHGVVARPSGSVVLTGFGYDSRTYPTTCGVEVRNERLGEILLTELAPDSGLQPPERQLLYSRLLGGNGRDEGHTLVMDDAGGVIIVGQTQSTDLPTTPGAVQLGHGGATYDGFVFRLELRTPMVEVTTEPATSAPGEPVRFTATGLPTPYEQEIVSYRWDFGDGTSSEDGPEVEHVYESPGRRVVELVVENADGMCRSLSSAVIVACPPGDVDPWTALDLGSSTFGGRSRWEGDDGDRTLTTCAGGSLFRGTSDDYHLVCQPLQDDFFVQARVVGLRGGGNPGVEAGAAGVVVRESLQEEARSSIVTIRQRFGKTYFSAYARVAVGTPVRTGSSDVDPDIPAWLRIERRGDVVTSYASLDGEDWGEPLQEIDFSSEGDGGPLPDLLYVGVMAAGQEPSPSASFNAVEATFAGVEIGALAPPAPDFIRGDADLSETFDLTDAIFTLSYLFLGGPTPPCLEAADSNDSGTLDLTDAVYLLNWLFLGGPEPPAPFGECGVDPTEDDLGCEVAPAYCG